MGAWRSGLHRVVGAHLTRHEFLPKGHLRCIGALSLYKLVTIACPALRALYIASSTRIALPHAPVPRASRLALFVPHKAPLPESGGLPFPMSEEYSSVLFVVRECYVYRVPPRTSAAGYRAGEWGDVDQSLWKGRMRIVEYKDRCEIRLEDGETGTSRG